MASLHLAWECPEEWTDGWTQAWPPAPLTQVPLLQMGQPESCQPVE